MVIKICGITRLEDAQQAVAHGATALGFVFWPTSPRWIAPERAAEIVSALPSGVQAVGVFVNEEPERVKEIAACAGLTGVQLHGDEGPEYAAGLGRPVLKAVSVEALGVIGGWPADTAFLVDAIDPVRRGGTGTRVDWDGAATFARRRRVILAGGLTPENVGRAIETVRPFGVDVSSGVEATPGVKDSDKVARFLANARAAFEAVVQ